MSIFGRIITDDQVEDAVVYSLRRWFNTYMNEVEVQCGLERGFYKRPVESSYTVRADFEKYAEEMIPLIVVVAPGIEDDPEKRSGRTYDGKFQVGVVCIASAKDQVSTRRMVYRMGAAVRGIILQQQSLDHALDDSVIGTDWLGARNNEIPSDADRSIWANRQLFAVQVAEMLTGNAGPIDPDLPEEEYPDRPYRVEEVDATIIKEPISNA